MRFSKTCLFILCGAVILWVPVPALATGCSGPTGIAGDQFYNSANNVMQYCNGTNWVNMGTGGGFGTLTSPDLCTTDGTVINCTTQSVPVANGGTGSTTLTAHGVLLGEGASPVTSSVGTANTVLQGNGSLSDPTWNSTLTGLTFSGGTFSGTTTLPNNGVISNTGRLGIGTSVPQSALQVSGGELQVSSGGGGCSSTNAGAIRYAGTALQYCNGSSWTTANTVSNIGSVGYFVLSKSTYDGNRGGLSGANATCLTELTTNTGWLGYSTALAAGQLTASNVQAFMCDNTSCNNFVPNATYYFANANTAIGGASFTTTAGGYGPQDNANWIGATYFGANTTYWTGMTGSGVGLNATYGASSTLNCTAWTSNSAAVQGEDGTSNSISGGRFNVANNVCSTPLHLICMVQPKAQTTNPGADVGWFVLLGSQHTGALGGLSGANSTCLTALQSGGWYGYTAANANGQLTGAKVFAFLCDGTTCQNLNANTTYYYACGLDSTAGGGSFTTDGSGLGPNNSSFWEEANAFGYCHNTSNAGSSSFWTGRASTSNTQWANSSDVNNCTAWTTASAGVNGQLGGSAGTTSTRWSNASGVTCLNGLSLVCYVNP
jgi:hypothetical protein